MCTVHVLQHAATEGPMRIAEIAQELGLGVRVHRLYGGHTVPHTIASDDLLVVMGGGMGVSDIGDPRWPFLASEVELIARCVRDAVPVLGVCLGAQLLAYSLGARAEPLYVGDPPVRHREVGWGAVTFVAPIEREPCLRGLHESETVLHWHGDTFDLPANAVRLASTLACPNQMFRLGQRTFGLQFHIEVREPDVSSWVREDADFVRSANGPSGAERILSDTKRFMPRHAPMADSMIRNILTEMLGRDPRAGLSNR